MRKWQASIWIEGEAAGRCYEDNVIEADTSNEAVSKAVDLVEIESRNKIYKIMVEDIESDDLAI